MAPSTNPKVDPKARLNMGDLFTYALAKETGLPLFFQGTDFANMNIVNAMEKLGYEMSEKACLSRQGKKNEYRRLRRWCLSLNFSLQP